jgi:heat-inducible transcriptional repressor
MSRQSPEPLPLSERSLFLFKALVEHFIEDGQPVGSRTLARDIGLELSPATIRNVMADLEDMGLLHSPHTSAGRVPTARGYRLFVDSLLRVCLPDEQEIRRIARDLEQSEDIQTLMARTSAMLSEITRLAGVVMLPRHGQQTLKQIEFVTLSDNRVLVILVVNDHEVQNRIIHTARPFKQAELQQAANYLNSTYCGRDLHTVGDEILRDLKRMKEDIGNLMQAAIEMAQRVLEPVTDTGGDYVLSGQTNLMGVVELADMERMRKLFESFNRKRDILHLMEQAVHARGVQIFIGEESGYEVLDNCSVVTSPYEVDGEILGVLGVIGPTRMHYERVIPIVDITAKMLGSALNSRV